MSKEPKRELNIADGLRRVKAIEQKFPVIAREISKYCSKKKGNPDEILGQKKHVESRIQKYNALMNEWTNIKLAIQTANLKTKISFKSEKKSITMSLAEAVLWKGIRGDMGGRNGRKDFENQFWNSFTTMTADQEIRDARALMTNREMTPEDLAKEAANLVPERLGWDEVKVQDEKEFLMDFALELDAIIDKANITTILKL